MTEPERDERRSRRPALLLLLLALIGVSICAWSLFANVTLGEAESFIAAPLHSAALANYAQDPIGGRLQSLSIRIIEFAIRDREPETDDAGARATDVVESLKSPVPTVTPKPGDPTYTPTAPSTAAPSATIGSTGTPTPTPSPTRTPSRTPTSTTTDLPTAGPSATPTKTPTPSNTPGPSNTPTPCKVPPYIEMISPTDGQHFTLAQELPGQAFAFDPDNANPLTCSTTPSGFDGQGIPTTATPTPAVEFTIERWNGVSWVPVHYQAQNTPAYCAFTGTPFCLTHNLSSGQWPDTTPINTGLHRMKARVVRDDEGVASGWVSVNFYIDPVPTATPSPTASNTPTPSPTVTPSPTLPVCTGIGLTGFTKSGSEAWLQLSNGPVGTIIIAEIQIGWGHPADLSEIKLAGTPIWSGDVSSPVSINSSWSGTLGDRQLGVSSTKELRFVFASGADPNGYAITVTFAAPFDGCNAVFNN